MERGVLIFPVIAFMLSKITVIYAQPDSIYIKTYHDRLTTRLYLSKKFTNVRLKNYEADYGILYLPNTTLNLGVGVTYQWATLNLALGFAFLNPDRGEGKTRYLDLQGHIYGRKIVVDLSAQFYRGFYLDNVYSSGFYVRPDLSVNHLGISAQYVFNGDRFSYRASFLQNEWQTKSSGSFLAGFDLFAGEILADSTLVPWTIRELSNLTSFPAAGSFAQGGPNAGYAYTLVIHRHYFFTASFSVSLNYGKIRLSGMNLEDSKYGFSANSIIRLVAGYNSEKWAFAISLVNSEIRQPLIDTDWRTSLLTGNIRATYVYRFKPSKRLKKSLQVFDKYQ